MANAYQDTVCAMENAIAKMVQTKTAMAQLEKTANQTKNNAETENVCRRFGGVTEKTIVETTRTKFNAPTKDQEIDANRTNSSAAIEVNAF